MLEEGEEAPPADKVACIGRKGARYRLAPCGIIDKARVGAGFAEKTGAFPLEGDNGSAVRDEAPLKIREEPLYHRVVYKTILILRGIDCDVLSYIAIFNDGENFLTLLRIFCKNSQNMHF